MDQEDRSKEKGFMKSNMRVSRGRGMGGGLCRCEAPNQQVVATSATFAGAIVR